MNSRSVVMDTLGCKLNQAETECLARRLYQAGYQVMPSGYPSDIYVLNTCTVTHIADRRARHLLRQARQSNPAALMVALGCYAQRAPAELAQAGIADIVLGNPEKLHLLKILGDSQDNGNGMGKTGFLPCPGLSSSRHRAMVKIQDGCNYFCSFCIVPFVRGRERSIPVEEIVAEVKERVGEGYKEVVLTGTNIGAYGHGQGQASLKLLVARLLRKTEINRLRLSSLRPQEVTRELLTLWSDRRLCRHFHLPLQSGCDRILQSMRRRYSTGDYRRAISLIRETIPEASITTDIMVGFPGEGQKEFEESFAFCQEVGFTAMHIFPFSPRSGTTAAEMPDQVKEESKRERKEIIRELSWKQSQDFRRQFIGQTLWVLWERKEGKMWNGLSDNYLRFFAESREALSNELLPVRVMGLHGQGVWGEIIREGAKWAIF